jgi:small-conductance mechanosensitive channel
MTLSDEIQIVLIIAGCSLALVIIYKLLKLLLTPLRILVRILLSLIVLAIIAYFVADYFGYDLVDLILRYLGKENPLSISDKISL